MRTSLAVFLYVLTVNVGTASTIVLNPGVYKVTTELLLPHLQDNLHYTTTHATRCLTSQSAANLFPILQHVSFANCGLAGRQPNAGASYFELVCRNAQAATGLVTFTVEPQAFRAVLDVKMGGKNMKFSQRISAKRLGACNRGR